MTGRAALELDTLTIRIPMRLQRRGGRKLIMTPEGAAMLTPKPRRDDTLIKALVRAHRWRRRIESGKAKSITDLAEQEGVTDAYACRLLPLTCLAPEIVEGIVDGRQPKGLRLAEMLGTGRLGGMSNERLGASAIDANLLKGGARLQSFVVALSSPTGEPSRSAHCLGPECKGGCLPSVYQAGDILRGEQLREGASTMIMPQQQREHGRAARCLGIEVQTPSAYQLFFRALFTSARSAGKTLSTASKAAESNSGSQAG